MQNHFEESFDNFTRYNNMIKEKQEIRRTANLIGVAYIILCLAPSFINRLFLDATKVFGNQGQVIELYSNPAFLMIWSTVISVLIFTLPFLIIPIGSGKKINELIKFTNPAGGLFLPMILIGVGASAFANISSNSITQFFAGFGIDFLSPEVNYPQGIWGFILSFIAVAVTPALVEEFAIRGIVLGSLKGFGEGVALLVSATIFSLMHGNLVQIPFAFVMGLVIGYAVIKTNSIWTGVIIHFINNAASVSLNYLSEKIESALFENAVMIFYFSICFFCFFIGTLLLSKKGNRQSLELQKDATSLTFGEKIKYFFSAPLIICCIILTIIDCLQYIHIA